MVLLREDLRNLNEKQQSSDETRKKKRFQSKGISFNFNL